MPTKPPLALASILIIAACVTSPSPPKAVQQEQEQPAFIQYRPGHSARFRLTARYEGTLTQKGPCLGVVRDGRFSTIIWPEGARMEFDAKGLVVSDGSTGARVRLGDYLKFTGGPIPKDMAHPFGEDALNIDMPMKCAHFPGYYGWIAIVNPGFRKGR
jgi:hypothetical protein